MSCVCWRVNFHGQEFILVYMHQRDHRSSHTPGSQCMFVVKKKIIQESSINFGIRLPQSEVLMMVVVMTMMVVVKRK